MEKNSILSRPGHSNDTVLNAISIHPFNSPASLMEKKLSMENKLLSKKYNRNTHFSTVFTAQSSFLKPNLSMELRRKEKEIKTQNTISVSPSKLNQVKEIDSVLQFTAVNPPLSSNTLAVADSVSENDKTVLSKTDATWDSTVREQDFKEKGRSQSNHSYHRPISSLSLTISSDFEHDWTSSSPSEAAVSVTKEGRIDKFDASIDIASSCNHVLDKLSSFSSPSSIKIQPPHSKPFPSPPSLLSFSNTFPVCNKKDKKMAYSPSSSYDPWDSSSAITMQSFNSLNSCNLIYSKKNHAPVSLSDVSLPEKVKSIATTLDKNGDEYEQVKTTNEITQLKKEEDLDKVNTINNMSENMKVATESTQNVSELDPVSDFQV